MSITIISHPDCRLHRVAPEHPESPGRVDAINDRLLASGLELLVRWADAPPVTSEQLLRVHHQSYLAELEHQQPEDGVVSIDGDTMMGPHTLTAAKRAAGAAVAGVDLVLSKKEQAVFCNVRPPGHHATSDQAMGFCFYNNIAVAAAHALSVYKLERVAILDFDVHHGNGTESIFKNDSRVLFCSIFQHPFYPYSGTESTRSGIVNSPMSSGSSSSQFKATVTEKWLPALDEFQPQLLFISAGFDGHREDDIAGLNLVDEDFFWVTQQIVSWANGAGNIGIVSVLEGGYELSALGRSALQHIKALGNL